MSNPSLPDLLKDNSEPLGTDNEFFLVTILDLELDTTYPLEFAWKYKDGTISEDWSSVYKVTTLAEPAPNAPLFQAADLTNDGASLVVRWTGVDNTNQPYPINFDRVEIFAKGGSFGETYVNTGYVFREAGTKVIAVSTGATYFVKLRAVTKRGTPSAFSAEQEATTVQQLVVDVQGPGNVSSSGLSISAGIDDSGGATIGFNGYLDLSWTAVSDVTLRGYRIRFRSGSTNYSYVDSPGTGTTYRLRGLAVGATYEVGIATYDELNNTSSSYTSFTATAISGTPFVGTNVNTTGYFSAGTAPNDFQFGFGIDPSNNSNTFAGTKRGLYFTSSNYWVIDSAQSAKLKIGGPTANYIEWNGAKLTVDGDITAKGGSFSGNILMSSTNASLYNISSGHTINANGTLPAGSTGFVLNASGLQFKFAGAERITLNAADGTITATNATITGTFKTAASGTRVEMNSASETNYIKLYSGSTMSYIAGESDGFYFSGSGRATPHLVLYGPTGAFSNGASFGSQVQIVQTDGTDTSADLTSFRLRNIMVTTTSPDTSAGAAGTSGGYGSIRLVRES